MEPDPQSRLHWPEATYNKKTADDRVYNSKNENVYNKKIDVKQMDGSLNAGNVQSMSVTNNFGQQSSIWWASDEVTSYLLKRIADLENENKSLRNENEALKKVAVGNNRFRVQPNQVKIEMSSWIK